MMKRMGITNNTLIIVGIENTKSFKEIANVKPKRIRKITDNVAATKEIK